MLSVLIPTDNSERLLVPTLAALVPGALAGVVREVIIADADSSDATAQIADAAGCRVMVSRNPAGRRLNACADAARAPWLLFVQPGVALASPWVEETRRFIEEAELGGNTLATAAVFQPRNPIDGRGSTLMEALALLATAIGGPLRSNAALVISKEFHEKLGGHAADAQPEREILRRIGRRRLVALRSAASFVR